MNDRHGTGQAGAGDNIDPATVSGFGDEWSRFDQSGLDAAERERICADYFDIFPWEDLPQGAVGADIGCGSGRWARVVAPRVGLLHLIDASAEALDVARRNLASLDNVEFHQAPVAGMPLADASLDFAYSLGVLHHLPDTAAAIRSVAAKLRPGAPLLVYLYYAFDNRPAWYRLLWRTSELGRGAISRLPMPLRYLSSQLLAAGVYWPLARAARVLERAGVLPRSWPLAYYRDKSFYVMRTDALDRFGTRLEQRFSQKRIRGMLESAGLERVRFSNTPPYWCALGYRA